jgi:hypothetical protein
LNLKNNRKGNGCKKNRGEKSKREFFNIKEEMMFNITESVLSDELIQNASAARERAKYTIGTTNPFNCFLKDVNLKF